MVSRRMLIAAAATVLGTAGVAFAPSASADQVWYQSVGRSSATTACPETTAADRLAGWSQWSPSWAQWNGPDGGYVCDRAVTWAYQDAAPTGLPSAGCVYVFAVDDDGPQPVNADFGGGWHLPVDTSSFSIYSDDACTESVGTAGFLVVYAPPGWDAATLCDRAWPGSTLYRALSGPNIYQCAQ